MRMSPPSKQSKQNFEKWIRNTRGQSPCEVGTCYNVNITMNAPTGGASSAPAMRAPSSTDADADDSITLWQPDATVSIIAKE